MRRDTVFSALVIFTLIVTAIDAQLGNQPVWNFGSIVFAVITGVYLEKRLTLWIEADPRKKHGLK